MTGIAIPADKRPTTILGEHTALNLHGMPIFTIIPHPAGAALYSMKAAPAAFAGNFYEGIHHNRI